TGTLTKGEFSVEEVVKTGEEDVLMLAAYCELSSNHPIARSIVEEYGRDNIDDRRITLHPKNSKLGAKIYLDEDDITVGNDIFMTKMKIKVPKVESDGVVVYVAKNDKHVGYIIIKDVIRDEAKEAIDSLKSMGINVAMITGDKQNVASKVANELGIKHIYAEMMPVDKVKKLRKLRKEDTKNQVFVGDGINDAPVLSSADVGIAMGALGSDAAIKVADVVLMDDNLLKLPLAIKIANKTKRIVYQNIIFALTVKIIVLVLAPLGISHMWEAIFADVGVSLLAILNSLRAARIKK
ncbi:MAG: HAD-IC family P-type ATPase, partial [Bacilli bacterium]